MKFDRVVWALLAVALLGMTGWHFAHRPVLTDFWQVEVQRNDTPAVSAPEPENKWPDSLLEGEVINLNAASAVDLARLPGIGPARAEAIVTERETKGQFSSVDDLLRVNGIGPIILEGLRPYVAVD